MGRILAVAAVLVVVTLAARSAPLEPVETRIGLNLPPFRRLVETLPFKADKRATVIAMGQQRTSHLGLYVYDSHGNCVAWDDLGSATTLDDMAVEWFPMQNEQYTMELRNLGAASSRFDIAIR